MLVYVVYDTGCNNRVYPLNNPWMLDSEPCCPYHIGIYVSTSCKLIGSLHDLPCQELCGQQAPPQSLLVPTTLVLVLHKKIALQINQIMVDISFEQACLHSGRAMPVHTYAAQSHVAGSALHDAYAFTWAGSGPINSVWLVRAACKQGSALDCYFMR